MDPLLKKMNYKDEAVLFILNTPEELEDRVKVFEGTTSCCFDLDQVTSIAFAIIFVLSEEEVEATMTSINEKLAEDCKLWFCYPKKSSKRYKCHINRDQGWTALGDHGFEPVRQVSINEDFSALRFRQVSKIKTITRSKEMALTQEAKDRTTDATAKKKTK